MTFNEISIAVRAYLDRRRTDVPIGLAEVAREALGLKYHEVEKSDWRRLAMIMKDAGWQNDHGGWIRQPS